MLDRGIEVKTGRTGMVSNGAYHPYFRRERLNLFRKLTDSPSNGLLHNTVEAQGRDGCAARTSASKPPILHYGAPSKPLNMGKVRKSELKDIWAVIKTSLRELSDTWSKHTDHAQRPKEDSLQAPVSPLWRLFQALGYLLRALNGLNGPIRVPPGGIWRVE